MVYTYNNQLGWRMFMEHCFVCNRIDLIKKGENPFIHFKMNRDGRTLRNLIKCYDPEPKDAYNCIFENGMELREKVVV